MFGRSREPNSVVGGKIILQTKDEQNFVLEIKRLTTKHMSHVQMKRLEFTESPSSSLLCAETGRAVIVDHANRLHECVNGGFADKTEAALF